jgi:uncharacterized protein YbjT (DUF2867 family)
MSILVTGATGTVGSLIVERLADAGADVKALVRTPGKVTFPKGVTEVVGDLTDVEATRAAFASVRTLFLLNAVVADEVTQALTALNLARDAGVERIVYLSVIHADLYTNVPHFTGKHTVERMITDFKLPATVLRPAYFMQNDWQVKSVVENHGVYPMPIGSAGVWMVDARDIADIATAELLKRDRAQSPLPGQTLDLVGPEALSGDSIAVIWSQELKREVRYGGNDTEAFERQMAKFMPAWMAYDMRQMMAGIQKHGMRPETRAVQSLEKQLGCPLRTYRNLVREMLNTKS